MHLSTDEPAASRMLEPFGEVSGDAPEYFSSRTHFANIGDKKLLRKIKSKNLTAGVFFFFFFFFFFLSYPLRATAQTRPMSSKFTCTYTFTVIAVRPLQMRLL